MIENPFILGFLEERVRLFRCCSFLDTAVEWRKSYHQFHEEKKKNLAGSAKELLGLCFQGLFMWNVYV